MDATNAGAGTSSAEILARAKMIAAAGGLNAAIETGAIPPIVRVTLAEALVLGLLRQGVRKYLAVFGHGNTAVGEVLRLYQAAGVTRTFNFRNEVAMAHAATALAWHYGEIPAVVTSIGPGALQAFAGSLAAASNGVGVWHLYGDETTFGEGYNMQQVPHRGQGAFAALTGALGRTFQLHTPEAVREALRQGIATVSHPTRPQPFYLLLPINTQPKLLDLSLASLPEPVAAEPVAPVADSLFDAAVRLISANARIVIKAGGGARRAAAAVCRLAERIGAAVVLSPGSTGVMPDAHPQNMHVGGSKGSISGNFAMSEAELLVVIGSRAVCQSDCSGIGYPKVRAVINVNADYDDVLHYNRSLALIGDAAAVIGRLEAALDRAQHRPGAESAAWLAACAARKAEWKHFCASRRASAPLYDAAWEMDVLTQPAAIGVVADFARSVGAIKYFDAGDVQANGFQLVEDDAPGDTFTESGASYMGFAVSGLMASAIADQPAYPIAFTGDGSFMMNPQILIDAVEHGLRAMIVLFDNRRMAAITNLQRAQYGAEFMTSDCVQVDYVRLASAVRGVHAVFGGATAAELKAALADAYAHPGLSLVHVPVYDGDAATGGMGTYGAWNVGNWVADVEARYLRQII
ncbi:MAG: thiamine pyrophosphate-dependent enzyme [Ancalomicrobiaceae bacterium]|nr:thiamine pyrophosphate-dependent enzyme [Ancalomicrobiaceae bacterium]